MFLNISDKTKNTIFLRSFRARLFIIILILGIVPCLIMRYGIVNGYENHAVEQRVNVVQNQLMIVANHLVSNNYLSNDRAVGSKSDTFDVIDAELETIANLYEGRVLIVNKNFKVVKDTYDLSVDKIIISEEVIRCFNGENISHYDSEHGYIEMTTPITDTNSSNNDIKGVMLTSISNDSIVGTMKVLSRKAVLVEALTLVVVLFLAFAASGLLTKPFKRVTNAIIEVRDGHRDEAISVTDYSETVHIVDAFNQMLAQMRAQEKSRQEFVSNVSHELKTPMASMKVLADSLLGEANVPAELYREFLVDIGKEIDRENQIITDLLSLVKMDKAVSAMNVSSISINEMTELVLKRLRPIARKKDVELVFESIRPVTAEVDEVKMMQIVTNLVENAIKYNKDHGSVKVTLDADYQYFTLEVADTGMGIPEEDFAHIYERFYRVDKSHSREIGGTGLGLAITKQAVLLHKGTIKVTSAENEGTTFVVKIPLNYIK
ncbi:MAG: HAMP domain-containing histidine kinase [Lachnospiraceae bacterium]|nr:HAMP domain-containing histidine kinase [Lachnospiraceae bacterium]